MATAREIRRLAFQALFQLDARGIGDAPGVREAMEAVDGFTAEEKDRAMALAVGAFDDRAAADRAMLELAPGWPASRQAAVDRAILRLAHHEMTAGLAHPKVAVNEAVELAKEFSGEKSPAFVNGLLDKVLKRVLAERKTPEAPEVRVRAEAGEGEPAAGAGGAANPE
jgi:transcription antitermination protein NusB